MPNVKDLHLARVACTPLRVFYICNSEFFFNKSLLIWQDLVSATYTDTQAWARMAIHNIASSGKFSSDRYGLGGHRH
jgi:hypothetical protein